MGEYHADKAAAIRQQTYSMILLFSLLLCEKYLNIKVKLSKEKETNQILPKKEKAM